MNSIYRPKTDEVFPEVMSTAQAARFLSIGRTVLSDLIQSKQIPCFKTHPGARPWKFRKTALVEWMKERESSSMAQKGNDHE